MFGMDDKKLPVVQHDATIIEFNKSPEILNFKWPKRYPCSFCGQYKEHVIESTTPTPITSLGPVSPNKVICYDCVKKCNQLLWQDLKNESV